MSYADSLLAIALKDINAAKQHIEWLREASRSRQPVLVPDNVADSLGLAFSSVRQVVYGLNEAMAALETYADKAFWTEVPEKTYAASDLGSRARTALDRINPA